MSLYKDGERAHVGAFNQRFYLNNYRRALGSEDTYVLLLTMLLLQARPPLQHLDLSARALERSLSGRQRTCMSLGNQRSLSQAA